jgi:hypothetical protein
MALQLSFGVMYPIMNIYIPSKFLQVTLHQNGGKPARLDDLLFLLEDLNFNPYVGIDIHDIKDDGILLLPTRQKAHPFQKDEIDFLVDFISNGNPLFHLSNHPPLTDNDSFLGNYFGYKFSGVVKTTNSHNFDIFVTPGTFLANENEANLHFTVRNTSIVSTKDEDFIVIADFSRSNVPNVNHYSAFGLAKPRFNESGAIVALGDSGLLGEPTINNPGPGLGECDNLHLIRRILNWLKNQAI